MTGFRQNKKLQRIDGEVEALESRRRELELRAFGAEVPAAERRGRYFAVADAGLRRQLIAAGRALHEARSRQRAAAIDYWETIATDTRRKLEDLRSDSPTAKWRRALWWDVLTLFWIFAGAGWLAYQLRGALAGTLVTAAAGWYVVRRREASRATTIRQGEELLRSSENELRLAQADAANPAHDGAPFSATEESSGVADPA
jgi:hypothetical protein